MNTQPVICSRCLYDANTPAIQFDDHGVCNYCKMNDDLSRQYPAGETGEETLGLLVERIRKEGRRKPFDVVVGVSGGCDSSYLIHRTVELGLRPLAVHFDNTWNSRISTENIHRVLNKLNVELFTYVVDNSEYDDILRSFMLAGLQDLEAPTDLGLATVLYLAAAKHGIKYIFEGHSFRTEGVSPLGWHYMDGKYIQSVVKRFGHYGDHRMKTYPNLWMRSFLWYTAVCRIKKIRPLYWMKYNKKEARRMLEQEYGWQWYGGHHLENRYTHFWHNYYLPKRFGIDQRVNGFAALVRSGQMRREDGLAELRGEPPFDDEILRLVKKRFGFSDKRFTEVMAETTRTFRDFKTYKPWFERLRPLFWLLARAELVPKSFYIKYTSKTNI